MFSKRLFLPIFFLLLVNLIIIPFSCQHEADGLEMIDEICFDNEILPIFQSSCSLSGCHDPGSAEGDYVLTNFIGIIKGVEPGKPRDSEIYQSLTNIWSDKMMPPDQPLAEQNRILIRLWIEQGAKYISCPDSMGNGTLKVCFQRDILPVLISSCAISNCHDAITAEEGLVYTNYTNTIKSVKPGNPFGSDLFEKITETDPNDIMPPPPYSRLSQAQIDSIFNWISYGALNEQCAALCDTINPIGFAEKIWPVFETSCRGCHNGAIPGGGVLLTSYSEITAQITGGKIPGVLRGGSFMLMPPSGFLSECTIREIEIWVEEGALNN